MSKLNIDMIREIKNNHPAVPEPFLNESKLLDVEEDCRKAFLSSRTGRLGAFGRAFHSFIEAPSGDLVSAYILAIDSEEERKADVLLRFYTAPGERAVLLYRDTIAFVSETMPEPGDTVTVKSSREFSKPGVGNRHVCTIFRSPGAEREAQFPVRRIAISDCLQGLFEHRYLSELRGTVPSKWNRILERCLLASVPNGSTP